MTLGPPALGWALSLLLAGVVAAWTGAYWNEHGRPGPRRDRLALRSLVVVVAVLEAWNAALSLWVRARSPSLAHTEQALWVHTVDQNRSCVSDRPDCTDARRDEAISSVISADALGSTACALIAILVQGYYLNRVRVFVASGRRRVLALLVVAPIAACALLGLAGGLGITIIECARSLPMPRV